MYRKKDRQTISLFPELFSLGGGLRADNRWMKLGKLIPWNQMEELDREYFSDRMGRPAKDSRLIGGLLMVKRTEGYSDEAFDAFVKEFESKCSKAVGTINRHRKSFLTFYDFLAEHW